MDDYGRDGGYTAASAWIASDPDSETFIFRKFDRLAALNLLYMQSEILELEKKIEDMHWKTVGGVGNMDTRDAASTLEEHIKQLEPGHEHRESAQERMDLILDLRSKLKTYHKAMLLQGQISNLKQPERRAIKVLRYFLEKPEHLLGGKAKQLFDEKSTNNHIDLVALRAPGETDMLSNFLRKHWRGKEITARVPAGRYYRYREDSIATVVNVVTILVAAVFLIGTIVGFHFVKKPEVKLGMIAGFAIAFAACLGLVTNARRVEIFAATAAYAAVLVVFVSNSELSAA